MTRRTHLIKRSLLSLLALVVIVPALFLGPFSLRVQHVEANPEAGFFADFFLYVSPGAKKAAANGEHVFILVQPNNSGTNSDDVDVHRKDAWWTAYGRHGLADELNVALLVPAFVRPGEDWHIYTHALDRDALTTDRKDLARPDLQLIQMIDEAHNMLAANGIETKQQILIQGYSASGMFANRFAALHPDRVRAVAAGSPGGWPLAPISRAGGVDLPYPIGVSDFDQLTGLSFDSVSYAQMDQLLVMGSLDDNDSVDFSDGWDEEHAAILDSLYGTTPLERWNAAKELYDLRTSRASFVLVDGIGHDRRKLQHVSTAFFKRLLEK